MKYYWPIVVLITSLLSIGCYNSAEFMPAKSNTFFDVNSFINGEIERLGKLNPTAKKVIILNDESEKQELNNINWESELALFKSLRINKTSWVDEFEIAENKNATTKISTKTYISNNEDVSVKKLIVQRKGDTVVDIYGLIAKDNWLHNYQQELTYQPDYGYLITYKSKAIFRPEKKGIIELQF